MMNKGFIILFLCFTISSCKPKKDYESIAKYMFQVDCPVINIDSIDNVKDIKKYRDANNSYNSGVYYNLEKLKISNDSGNLKCVLPLFSYQFSTEDGIVCRNGQSLKINIEKNHFIANDSIFYYNNLINFDIFIREYTYKSFKTNQDYLFESKWNLVIINDSTSFKYKLFPVLNTMYKAYIETCLQNPDFKFSYDAKRKIKDFYTEVTIFDYTKPPVKFKSKIKFKTPKSIN